MESEISNKINELVDLIMKEKIVLYETLVKNIITYYKNKNVIDKDKINLCIEMMNIYYEMVNEIDNLFNLSNK